MSHLIQTTLGNTTRLEFERELSRVSEFISDHTGLWATDMVEVVLKNLEDRSDCVIEFHPACNALHRHDDAFAIKNRHSVGNPDGANNSVTVFRKYEQKDSEICNDSILYLSFCQDTLTLSSWCHGLD